MIRLGKSVIYITLFLGLAEIFLDAIIRIVEVHRPKNFKKIPGTTPIAKPGDKCVAYVRGLTTYTSPVAFDPERAMGILACDRVSCPVRGSLLDETTKAAISGGGRTPKEAIDGALESARTIIRSRCKDFES